MLYLWRPGVCSNVAVQPGMAVGESSWQDRTANTTHISAMASQSVSRFPFPSFFHSAAPHPSLSQLSLPPYLAHKSKCVAITHTQCASVLEYSLSRPLLSRVCLQAHVKCFVFVQLRQWHASMQHENRFGLLLIFSKQGLRLDYLIAFCSTSR